MRCPTCLGVWLRLRPKPTPVFRLRRSSLGRCWRCGLAQSRPFLRLGTPERACLAQACEDFFAAQGHGCTVHLLSHAAPELLPSLLERGYGLSYVLHAYGHDLQVLPPLGRPQITELPDAEADAWANISARGFGPEAEAVMRQISRAAGTRRLVAWQAGQPAASAAVSLVNGVAAFFGTSTAPQFRAQGLQAALLAYRLHLAQAAGADCASVFVTPSSGSERNVQRAGFRLAGLRLTFTKPLSPAAS